MDYEDDAKQIKWAVLDPSLYRTTRTYEFSELFPVNGTDIDNLYWRTDCPLKTIALAFDLADPLDVLDSIGPAELRHIRCSCCRWPVHVCHRTEAERVLAMPHKDILCTLCHQSRYPAHPQRGSPKRSPRNALQFMTWSEYVKTTHWQRMEKRALAAAHHTCQNCLHYRARYVKLRDFSKKGHEDLSDLMALCRGCWADVRIKRARDF